MWKEKESKTMWIVGLITWDLIREPNAGDKEISMNKAYSWEEEWKGGQHKSLFFYLSL